MYRSVLAGSLRAVPALVLTSLALLAPSLPAQERKTQTTEQAPEYLKKQVYIRRFSAGATLAVYGFKPMIDGSTTNDTASPPVISDLSSKGTDPFGHRFGGGITAQFMVKPKYGIVATGLLHKISFQNIKDNIEGIDNPNTTADERTFITDISDTSARLLDFSVLLRRYDKDRFTKGARWFFEGGGAVRHVSNLRTSTSTILNGTSSCCKTTPVPVAHKNARGVVGGIGAQFVDDFGIHLVPEVRYTRWLDRSFDSFATKSRRDQIEAMVSITF